MAVTHPFPQPPIRECTVVGKRLIDRAFEKKNMKKLDVSLCIDNGKELKNKVGRQKVLLIHKFIFIKKPFFSLFSNQKVSHPTAIKRHMELR